MAARTLGDLIQDLDLSAPTPDAVTVANQRHVNPVWCNMCEASGDCGLDDPDPPGWVTISSSEIDVYRVCSVACFAEMGRALATSLSRERRGE